MTATETSAIRDVIENLEAERFRLLESAKTPSGNPGMSVLAIALRSSAQSIARQIVLLKTAVREERV